jgi:hypothetical protein
LGDVRARVKGLNFQTETPPLLVILGVQVFERDRRGLGTGLSQIHAGASSQSPACNLKAWR